jgi:hypothetical protein
MLYYLNILKDVLILILCTDHDSLHFFFEIVDLCESRSFFASNELKNATY